MEKWIRAIWIGNVCVNVGEISNIDIWDEQISTSFGPVRSFCRSRKGRLQRVAAHLVYPASFLPLVNPFFSLPIISFPPSVHLSVSVQDQRVATCSSTTSLRSLGMESWCRCSCLSVMSSPPKCLWIERQTKVNALVGKNDQTEKILVISSSLFFLTNHLLYCSLHPPPSPPQR